MKVSDERLLEITNDVIEQVWKTRVRPVSVSTRELIRIVLVGGNEKGENAVLDVLKATLGPLIVAAARTEYEASIAARMAMEHIEVHVDSDVNGDHHDPDYGAGTTEYRVDVSAAVTMAQDCEALLKKVLQKLCVT